MSLSYSSLGLAKFINRPMRKPESIRDDLAREFLVREYGGGFLPIRVHLWLLSADAFQPVLPFNPLGVHVF